MTRAKIQFLSQVKACQAMVESVVSCDRMVFGRIMVIWSETGDFKASNLIFNWEVFDKVES